jgi:hypothetical protein
MYIFVSSLIWVRFTCSHGRWRGGGGAHIVYTCSVGAKCLRGRATCRVGVLCMRFFFTLDVEVMVAARLLVAGAGVIISLPQTIGGLELLLCQYDGTARHRRGCGYGGRASCYGGCYG